MAQVSEPKPQFLRLSLLRELKGLSQDQLSEKSTVERKLISDMEIGKRSYYTVTYGVLARLARALGAPMQTVFPLYNIPGVKRRRGRPGGRMKRRRRVPSKPEAQPETVEVAS
jgi:transcriptional regulator with XRE-family HTH domain